MSSRNSFLFSRADSNVIPSRNGDTNSFVTAKLQSVSCANENKIRFAGKHPYPC